MNQIDDTLNKHHVQYGLVGGVSLTEPGRLDGGHSQHSNDNDGLWTSLHVAADYFRADARWWLGEEQVVNGFNLGSTVIW